MNSIRVCFPVAVMSLMFVPEVSPAQNYSGGFTSTDCAAIMSTASSNPAQLDTLSLTRHCSGFADTMVVLLGQTGRVTSDLPTYDRITVIAGTYTEGPIFTAALTLANNASEPELARVAALSILLNYSTTGRFPQRPSKYAGYSGASSGCYIVGGGTSGVPGPGVTPLPSDYRSTTYSLAQSLTAGSAPNSIKWLASCIISVLAPHAPEINQPENVSFSPANFSFVKQCGRKFLLRNSSYAAVTVALAWLPDGGTTLTDRLFNLPPRQDGESYSEVSWTVPQSGGYALVYLGVEPSAPGLMMNQTPNNTPC